MEIFLTLDQQLFLLINHLPHNELFDFIALAVSGVGTAGIIWFLFGAWFFLREEKKDHWFAFKLGVLGLSVWGLVEEVIKPMVARSRPSLEMGAIVVGGGSGGFSFPSGHAAIAWAMAIFLSYKEPRLRKLFYALALAISLSRIYLGVHYPLDVVAGGILGFLMGKAILRLIQ